MEVEATSEDAIAESYASKDGREFGKFWTLDISLKPYPGGMVPGSSVPNFNPENVAYVEKSNEASSTTAPEKQKKTRLSGRWMTDHLDCWQEEVCPMPVGTFSSTGKTWEGFLTESQVKELDSRTDYYVSFTGDDKKDNIEIVNAAKSVRKSLGLK